MLAHLSHNNSKELDTYRYSASVAIDITSVAIDIDVVIVAIAIASIDIAIASIAIGLWFLYIHTIHPRLD